MDMPVRHPPLLNQTLLLNELRHLLPDFTPSHPLPPSLGEARLYPDRIAYSHCHYRNFGRYPDSYYRTRPRFSPHAQCASNMRQLTQSALLYAQDNRNRLPPTYKNPVSSDKAWWQLLYPDYCQASGVYKCPDDQTPFEGSPPYTGIFTRSGRTLPDGKVSYGISGDGEVDPRSKQRAQGRQQNARQLSHAFADVLPCRVSTRRAPPFPILAWSDAALLQRNDVPS